MYSLGLYISGSMGDHFDPKKLIIVFFVLVTVLTSFISLGGFKEITSIFYYMLFFALNGAVQSTGWPSCITIFTNWFGKKGRGLKFGMWSSCSSMGNIFGYLLTSFFTETLEMEWYSAYAMIGLFCTVTAIFNGFLCVVHPEEAGVNIEEIDHSIKESESFLLRQ
jgi:OPA family glycerol-3-phosphate transporter-like MFS transporter 1/2